MIEATPRHESPAAYCRHQRLRVDARARTLKCSDCECDVDPFQALENFVLRERQLAQLSKEITEARQRLQALEAEEKRVKARTRQHSRKDAEAAVEAEREKHRQRFEHLTCKLDSIRGLVDEVDRALGTKFASEEQLFGHLGPDVPLSMRARQVQVPLRSDSPAVIPPSASESTTQGVRS